MPTTTTRTVEQLATEFNRCFETFEAPEGLFADDAFFDLYPPMWRFQLQGAAAVGAQLRAISEGCAADRAHPARRADGLRVRHGARGGARNARSPAG